MTTMNTENYDKAEQILVHLQDMIASEKNEIRKVKLKRAAELMQWACAYIAHDRNDDAGRCIKNANRIFREAIA